MVTTYQKGRGSSGNANVAPRAPTDEERAFWAWCEPFADDKTGIWIDPTGPGSLYLNGAAGDAPAGFKLVDRIGDRIFTPDPIQGRHPFVATDSITGKPVWMFGAGGSGGNALSQSANGTLVNASVLDDDDEETNNLPLILPGVGWSFAAKVRVPAPSATINGVTYGATVGGSLFGGASTDATTDFDNFSITIDTGAGYYRMFNQRGIVTTNQWYSRNVDFRDGAWHDYVAAYDHVAGSYQVWIDGVGMTSVTGVTTDILPSTTQTGVDKPMVGAVGNGSGGPASRFSGALAFMVFLQTPILAAEADARTAVRALMATR